MRMRRSQPPAPLADPPSVPEAAPHRARRRRGRMLLGWLATICVILPLCLLVGFVAALMLSQKPFQVPDWAMDKVEARVNSALAGTLKARLSGGADLVVAKGFQPQIRLHDVELLAPSGRPIALVPELQAAVRPGPLLRRRLALSSITLAGAAVSLRRLEDGSLDIDLGGAGNVSHIKISSLTDVTDAVEKAFATPVLRDLSEIRADTIDIRLDDTRLDRVWRVSDGRFKLTQDNEKIALVLGLNIGEQDEKPAQLSLGATTYKDSSRASFGSTVTGMPARDLAVQSPALAALAVLDAPISGSISTYVDEAGELSGMNAKLTIAAGALSPAEGAKPIAFDGADLELKYDPEGQRIAIEKFGLASAALLLDADGQVLLKNFHNGLPKQLLAQIALNDLKLDPEGVLEQPAHFSDGALELRIDLDPFHVDLGQMQLIEENTQLSAHGSVAADQRGWHVSLDAGINQISSGNLLALWPPLLVTPARKWAQENIAEGQLKNVQAAVRIGPGEAPRLNLGYEFSGADVRAVKTLPNVQEARGFASLDGKYYTMMVEEGAITASNGGRIEVGDTTLRIGDIRQKPAPADIMLVTRSQIPATLSLLDEPPFNFLSKAGKSTDLAQGWAEARTRLKFPMMKGLKPEDFDYDVSARLTDVSSDKIVPGKTIRSKEFRMMADPEAGLRIGGRGLLENLRFDAWWKQKIGPQGAGRSSVEGYLNITPEGLTALGVALPDKTLSGSGWAALHLQLRSGQTTRYELRSDMKGIGISIPQIDWSKPANAKGLLEISGALSQPPTVDKLHLEAGGLTATGSVALRPNGAGLERARFDTLRIGSWFSGAADLLGQGRNAPPGVSVRSGTLRLAQMPKSGVGGAGAAKAGQGQQSTPLSVRLDRVILTDELLLSNFRGAFNTQAGFNGAFEAQLNGGAAVRGAIGPAASGRAALRLEADDTGGLLRSAKLFDNAKGGQATVNLSPVGASGYDGEAEIRNIGILNAPTLASILSAASIVGLVEQLNGDGIVFNEAYARFRLENNRFTLAEARATGASLGITMNGTYDLARDILDMQGLISPLYIVNGIGQILTRRGEGLFGLTYHLRGSKAAPKAKINPLSLLAPGAVRNLFRDDPPVLPTQ
ncbi:hypothetical protein ERN12_04880 [Rhodobacteraceae bacterium]|nr:hypothetical protein ERN12_04880 [Paracoccaceae bacterium]